MSSRTVGAFTRTEPVQVSARAPEHRDLYRPAGHTVANGGGEVAWWNAVPDHFPKDLPRFFFHRPSVLGSPDAQTLLQPIIEAADRHAGHDHLVER